MTFKTILVLHDTDMPPEAVLPAIELAASLDAHLSVLVLGLTPQPPMSSGYGAGAFEVWGDEFARMGEIVDAKAESLAQWMEQHRPSEGFSFDVGHEYSQAGSLSLEVSRRVRYADMSLISGRYNSESLLWQQALKGALYDTGRPILLLNDKPCPVAELQRAMLCWDAGVQASTAIKDAAPLLAGAADVHIAMVDPQSATERFGDEPGADLATYLARHQVPLSVCALASSGKSVADTLLQHAADMDAQVIVMGAYGHSRLQEWFLGSTTSDMLKAADRPLLLAH